MTDIIIQGICGRMGHALLEKIAARTDCRVVAGVDQVAGTVCGVPVVQDLALLPAGLKPDVLIDFSAPEASLKAARYCAAHGLPCVICTTGFDAAGVAALNEAAQRVAMFRSGNMSLGVNVLIELVKQANALLGGEFDIEIVEKHHHNKLDAPSGTALMIADGINEAAGGRYEYVYDRHAVRRKRDAKELGISAVRGGGIVGEHEVLFCGPEEVLTISHHAQSRGLFADGAIQAALFLAGKPAGLYAMSDMIREKTR